MLSTLLRFLLPISLLAILLQTQASAQPTARAYFYSSPGFRGECLVVDLGANMPDLAKVRDSRGRRWDDRIASLRIEGPAVVVLYADPRFRGDRIEFRNAVPDLARIRHGETGLENWDARATSLKVEFRGPVAPPVRHFFSQRDADRAIERAFHDVLGRAPDHGGFQHYRRLLLDEGWDDRDMREDLYRSEEYRRRDFSEIVRRCYRESLGREPDSRGLDTYVRAMRDRGMTEFELKTELRRSNENRGRVADEIVRRAYRDVLGRDPDPEGFRHYIGLVQGGWTEERVREELRRSPEARTRH